MDELLFAAVWEKCLERAVRRAPVGAGADEEDLNESTVWFDMLTLWPAVWICLPGERVVLRNGTGVSWDDRFTSQFLRNGLEMTGEGRGTMSLRRNRPRRLRWKSKEGGGWRGRRRKLRDSGNNSQLDFKADST